ncbi:alpha/beta fold hydrolase [Castellaniella sp.]|uniref:alpha/beta fold hydrolase n=1 Tax=Castellaniella sp. TaxID=1955812 RepID=UPI0035619348
MASGSSARHGPGADIGEAVRIRTLSSGPLHYVQAGQGDPVLLIHGSLCDYRYWRWQIAALQPGHTIIAPSLRGCWPAVGRHPQKGYGVMAHARDLQELLHALDCGAAHIVGHSRGAEVAWALVRQAPGLCRSLTLADPGFRFADEPESPPFYAQTAITLQQGDTTAALAEFVDTVNGADTWRKMVPWFKEMAQDNAMTLLSQVQEQRLVITDAEMARLALPVLLIGGAQSPAKYGQRLERLERLVPNARRTRIAMAAHGMNLANPRAFNRALLGFFETARCQTSSPQALQTALPDHSGG